MKKKGKNVQYGYASNQIWKFNTITEEWQLIGSMKVRRCHHKAVYLNGKVIVSGGWTKSGIEMNSTEIFDPHHTRVKSILVGNLNVPRYMHGMGIIVKNGTRKIIVFGGLSGENNPKDLDSIEEWDPKKREWTLVKQKLSEGRVV